MFIENSVRERDIDCHGFGCNQAYSKKKNT